jgi:hypothetical protein
MKLHFFVIISIYFLFGCANQSANNQNNEIVKQDSLESQIEYYPSGKVKSKWKFYNELNFFDIYYYSEDGRTDSIEKFVGLNNKAELNEMIRFKKNGEIDYEKSWFYSLKADKDTIRYGEDYSLQIKLEASGFDQFMFVLIGDYDIDYNILDSLSIDTLKGESFTKQYKTNHYKKGKNILRGIIWDFEVLIKRDSSQEMKWTTIPMYFAKEFYVK